MVQFLKVTGILVLLCVANVLSYVFRGLVPAAPVEFQAFIQQSLQVPSDSTSFYFGLLESVFIATYSISVVASGYLSKTVRPFQLLALGLLIWCVASILCGVAQPANNFYILLVGRTLSGVGDSCIQALTPPFIERYAAKERRSLWMGVYYGGVAIGTGLSYFYGSVITRALGWQWAFYICALMMSPVLLMSQFCVPEAWNQPLEATTASSSFSQDLWSIVRSLVFVTSSLGGAAYAFTLTGLATFAPAILIGAGTFSAEWSTTIFGIFIVVTGVIGSPLGGILMDRAVVGREHDESFRLVVACQQQLLHVVVGMPFLVATAWCLNHPVWFSVCLTIGLTSTFGTFSSTTMSVMLSVPPQVRGLAIGIFTTIIHDVGDVPAPIVVGLVKDWFAPGCGSTRDPHAGNGVTLSSECFTDSNRHGLQMTMLAALLWLGWSVLLWTITWWVAKRNDVQHGFRPVSTPANDDHQAVAQL